MISVQVTGAVNKSGVINVKACHSIEDVLDQAGGLQSGKRLELVQIGGALGVLIKTRSLDTAIQEFAVDSEHSQMMFIANPFCPVDYLRFLTRYCIRELKVDNAYSRSLNKLIEEIANGKAQASVLDEVQNVIQGDVEDPIMTKVFNLFDFIIQEYHDEIMRHIMEKKCTAGICRGLITAQCINACPGEVHVPGYVEFMKREQYQEAYALMRQANPLSLVCGYVCARPCEDRCRRGEIEQSVGVRALKKYCSNTATTMTVEAETKLPENGKSVAVIGAGPAGLSSAYYLARSGYAVTIYESEEKPGGMLTYGIPDYRLPYDVIDKEVDLIRKLGVNIQCGVKVGEHIDFKVLQKENDAVLLATGRPMGVNLGPRHPQIHSAVDFLRDVQKQNQQFTGITAVIGGGDVAIDAARTSLRLGSEKVYVISLESDCDMPASSEEVELAMIEGVTFIHQRGLESISLGSKNESINSIKLKRCTHVMDRESRFAPQYDLTDIMEVNVDRIVYAIGQQPDLSYLPETIRGERNRLDVDKNYALNTKGIFAIGDVLKPGIAIEAIAQGKKAAASIDLHLGGNGLYFGENIVIPEVQLKSTMWDIERCEERHRGVTQLENNFDLDTISFSYEDAIAEADRCMRCDRNSKAPLHLR